MMYIKHHQAYMQSENSQFFSFKMLLLLHMSHIYYMSTHLRF